MTTQLLASTLRVSTPLIFAALGGMFSERAGVINIALEGMMLLGAFGAAVGTLVTHSPWLGLVCGMASGVLMAAIYGLFVIHLRANQIVAGMAINMLALGLTPFLSKILYDVTGSTPAIPIENRFQSAPLYLCWIFVLLSWFWMKYTPAGLWFSFAGEHPEALDAAGIRVNRVRWMAVLLSGALAGMGGASLSIFLSSSFSRNMTAGRGFIALAALIFGKWKPVPAAIACLLFGFTEALQIRLQGVILWGHEPIPVQFIQILPYVVTIFVLAGFVGHSRAPKALGIPFRRR
ncbi:ABC transporter permease [Pedosphaera parvula]|uniref:Inner-membrane translocator n=1 Tax=Pedosphaera parvula (strain Ellin514) TaxID=320771 RepID=B9XRR3_PEDPL|nr:ABC transporter permease [Pedosphaera parvula]EEF57478.1 inner-membrane translocator [Pedosphaera parvula Ellin514]